MAANQKSKYFVFNDLIQFALFILQLYLQNNRLTSIDMHLLLNWKALTHLDLTENPWTCECENQWMVDELIPIYLTIDEDKAKALRSLRSYS